MIYRKTETIISGALEGQSSFVQIVVCDYCSKNSPMGVKDSGWEMPVGWGWVAIPFVDGEERKHFQVHFCSEKHRREWQGGKQFFRGSSRSRATGGKND